jgi:hypothetical protein
MLTLRENHAREDPENHQGEKVCLEHKVIFQCVHSHKKEKRPCYKHDIQQEMGCAAASFEEMVLKYPTYDSPDANSKRIPSNLTHTKAEEKVE